MSFVDIPDLDPLEDEEVLVCDECESELDPDGVCANELCAWFGVIQEGVPPDRWIPGADQR